MKRSNPLYLAALLLPFCWTASSEAAECRAKTAGFFLQFKEFASPVRLPDGTQKDAPPLLETAGNSARGQAVLTSAQRGNCLSCHKISTLSSIPDQGGVGPVLDGAGTRYTDAQLRLWIINPKAYSPKTIMPSYHTPGSPPGTSVLEAAEVEDLVAYMRTLK